MKESQPQGYMLQIMKDGLWVDVAKGDGLGYLFADKRHLERTRPGCRVRIIPEPAIDTGTSST